MKPIFHSINLLLLASLLFVGGCAPVTTQHA